MANAIHKSPDLHIII